MRNATIKRGVPGIERRMGRRNFNEYRMELLGLYTYLMCNKFLVTPQFRIDSNLLKTKTVLFYCRPGTNPTESKVNTKQKFHQSATRASFKIDGHSNFE
jgi:hypothetical protein